MRGFTLIELMTALVIVGIAVAIVVPRLVRDDRDVLAQEAARLALLLEQARDEAVASGRPIAWSSQGAVNGFWTVGAGGDWEKIAGDEVFRDRSLAEGVRIARLTLNRVSVAPNTRIVFTPAGTSAPFTLTLEMRGEGIAVVGDALGRIAVESPGGEGRALSRASEMNA